MSIAINWGTTPTERELSFPCDKLATDDCNNIVCRGVTVSAPAAIVYKWLCQLRVAPYSYDWIDNLGRRSPRILTPGLDDLATDLPALIVFEIADFERDRSITLRAMQARVAWIGTSGCMISYMIVPRSESECRLLVKMVFGFRLGVVGKAMSWLLTWADLIMMRKQLLNFKALAEKAA